VSAETPMPSPPFRRRRWPKLPLLFTGQQQPCTLPLTRTDHADSGNKCALDSKGQYVWQAFIACRDSSVHRSGAVRHAIEYIVRTQMTPVEEQIRLDIIHITIHDDIERLGYEKLQQLFNPKFKAIHFHLNYDGSFQAGNRPFKAEQITIHSAARDLPNMECADMNVYDMTAFPEIVRKLVSSHTITLVVEPDHDVYKCALLHLAFQDGERMLERLQSSEWKVSMAALFRYMLEGTGTALEFSMEDESSAEISPEDTESWLRSILPYLYPATQTELPSTCRIVKIKRQSGRKMTAFIGCDRQHQNAFLKVSLDYGTNISVEVVDIYGLRMDDDEKTTALRSGRLRRITSASSSPQTPGSSELSGSVSGNPQPPHTPGSSGSSVFGSVHPPQTPGSAGVAFARTPQPPRTPSVEQSGGSLRSRRYTTPPAVPYRTTPTRSGESVRLSATSRAARSPQIVRSPIQLATPESVQSSWSAGTPATIASARTPPPNLWATPPSYNFATPGTAVTGTPQSDMPLFPYREESSDDDVSGSSGGDRLNSIARLRLRQAQFRRNDEESIEQAWARQRRLQSNLEEAEQIQRSMDRQSTLARLRQRQLGRRAPP
jgi:hypothetical protein